MRRFVKSAMLGLGVAAVLAGCDVAPNGDVSDVSKAILAARGISADALMTQTRTQDRLKDGTGVNCVTAKQMQNGQGLGDVLRLRDGSCQQ